ncbi:hypothetical protein OHD16_06100 [Sphingobacterium sp. ML3W]|uniref:hypothetical protein n=1 Tax=Sphingobacterium sp. ML3W TaxID=1538644 RepID=UPI00249AB2FB|nr:hypothetical protein [Sphingobacterium sp. ML3W]WFA79539.1 hypothetical protein OGI71_26340 [Sphingobacterium sp. ML3W]
MENTIINHPANRSCEKLLIKAIQTGKTRRNKDRDHLTESFQKLIAELYDEENTTFGSGVVGMAWRLEWIVKKKLFLGFDLHEVEEILEDVDNFIYKRTIYQNASDFSLTDGLLGDLYYLVNRLDRISPEVKKIPIAKCIFILIDRLSTAFSAIVSSNVGSSKNVNDWSSDQLKFFSQLFHILSFVPFLPYTEYGVIQQLIDKMSNFIKYLFIESLDMHPDEISQERYTDLLMLSVCYHNVGKKLKISRWEKRGKQYTAHYIGLMNFDEIYSAAFSEKFLRIYGLIVSSGITIEINTKVLIEKLWIEYQSNNQDRSDLLEAIIGGNTKPSHAAMISDLQIISI